MGRIRFKASGEKSFENVARRPDQMPAFTKGSPISKRELKLTDQHAVLQAPLWISSCNRDFPRPILGPNFGPYSQGGSMAEWFVRWTTKLAIRVRSQVAAGLPTGYSGGNLTGYCCQQYRPRLDNRGGNGTHRGLCWKQVVPSIPGGDFRRLPTLNKRPLPFLPFKAKLRCFSKI